MSDTDPTPEAVDTVPEPTEPDTPESTEATPEDKAEATPGDKAAREAAKYRRRLREVEAERDRLAAQVEDLLRAEIERLSVTEHHIKAAALWAAGYTVADLVGEDGRPDESKVAAAAADVAERFGINRFGGAYVPAEGRTPNLSPKVTWDKLLHPNRP